MKKSVILPILFLASVGLSGCGQQAQVVGNNSIAEVSEDCINLCNEITGACSTAISQDRCLQACPAWSTETKEKIGAISSCEQVAEVPELAVATLPEMNEPNLAPASNDCEAACGSYVGKCLTLVPNASEALFQEGMSSCMGECAGWSTGKVDCMISAFDCEAMTNVCGL